MPSFEVFFCSPHGALQRGRLVMSDDEGFLDFSVATPFERRVFMGMVMRKAFGTSIL